MSEKQTLWPEQYVNRRVQQHDAVINALIMRVEALESILAQLAEPAPAEQESKKPRAVAHKK